MYAWKMQIILISMLFSFAFQWLHVPPQIIPQDMLRKYVTYAKQNVFPRMADADSDKIALVYADRGRQLPVRGAGRWGAAVVVGGGGGGWGGGGGGGGGERECGKGQERGREGSGRSDKEALGVRMGERGKDRRMEDGKSGRRDADGGSHGVLSRAINAERLRFASLTAHSRSSVCRELAVVRCCATEKWPRGLSCTRSSSRCLGCISRCACPPFPHT